MRRGRIIAIISVIAILVVAGFLIQDYFLQKTEVQVLKVNKQSPRSEICAVVKWEGKSRDILVEAGILSDSTFNNWFPALAVFPSGSNECCPGQPNIDDKYVHFNRNEVKEVCFSLRNPYYGIEDKCGNADYYSESNDYEVYVLAANKCHYKDGIKQSGFKVYGVDSYNFGSLP